MKIRLRYTRKALLAVLLAASAVLALLGPGPSGWLRGVAQVVLAPLGDGGMYLTTAFESHASESAMRPISPAEAKRYQEEIRRLGGQVHGVTQEYLRAKRRLEDVQGIRGLYGPIRDLPCELIPARVVGADSLPYGSTREINAGGADGAGPGAMVTTRKLITDRSKALLPAKLRAITAVQRLHTVAGSVLVGQLVATGRFTARLQLVTDRGFEMPARIRRIIDPADPRTIKTATASEKLTKRNNTPIDITVRGDGAGGLVVREVKADHNIRPGDWLVTNGGDDFLPVEVRIGTVVKVVDHSERPNWHVTVHAAPAVDLSAVRNVYIVLPVGSLRKGLP